MRGYPDFLTERRGACHAPDVDPELFVAEGDRGQKRLLRIEEAKAICWRCVHRQACGLWALRTHQAGVWGATTDSERDEMRHQGHAAAA